ncbi:hypothetical protein L596_026097 [Steinernema carpocapsae]|uniref:Uncharacterized protein n=1 Tax=Steinernema carpocapsae TaxID=34508 RepID=A0A4U5M0C5_STECR|nr:hypothetical protein L596_026097 [Steinernema carpocapsae]
MGAVCSSPEVRAALIRDSNISKQLRKDELDEAGNQKLLLLGAGECGKSTILKQMQILHKNGFTHSELMDKRGVIYSHLITALVALCRFADQKGLMFTDNDRNAEAEVIYDWLDDGKDMEPPTPEVYEALKNLWADNAIQEAYKLRNYINVSDSTEYFFTDVDRISQADYCPSTQDILHIRVPTTGVVQVMFPIKGCVFRVFDVGGQRSERRKWIHLFDDVNAIIFISAINEYDQVLAEDGQTIRLLESMQLFQQICNCKWFNNSSMILFLNKKDLFIEKIQKTSIKILFDNYKGQNSYADSVAYIRKKFMKLNSTPQTKKIYIHETCATDTNQVQLVIDSVIDIVIGKNLRGTGME